MKVDALWLDEIGKIAIRPADIADDPDVDQAQVEIKACGICAGDIAMWTGVTKKSAPMPFQFGHEGVGVVRKVGRKVTNVKPGDKVFIAGGGHLMSQCANVDAKICGKIPDSVSDYSLWIGEPVVCAVSALANCPVDMGDTVVLIGTGYMGLLNVMGYLASPIGRLVCLDVNEERLSIARDYGAKESFDLRTSEGERAIEEIHAEGGADVVCECSASKEGLDLAYSLMRVGGKLNQFAWHRRDVTYDATPQHLGGWKIYNTSPFIDPHIEDRIRQTARLMSRGLFDQARLITHAAPYEKAQGLMEMAAAKRNGYIKGAVTF